MSQSRRMSAVETIASTAIGYVVAVISQVAIFTLFGIHIPLTDNLIIGLFFTVVSILRGYCVRRVFSRIGSRSCTSKNSTKSPAPMSS